MPEAAVSAIHEELIAEHGGKSGLRDSGLLSASLARPRHLFSYSENATLFDDLAAAYGYGMVWQKIIVSLMATSALPLLSSTFFYD